MDKKEKIAIFEQTMRCADEWKYVNNNGVEQKLLKKDYGMSFDDAKLYDRDMSPVIKELTDIPNHNTEITVENRDCLYVVCGLIDDGYNPAVLNMASFKRPGGGVKNGSSAQEDIFCNDDVCVLSDSIIRNCVIAILSTSITVQYIHQSSVYSV